MPGRFHSRGRGRYSNSRNNNNNNRNNSNQRTNSQTRGQQSKSKGPFRRKFMFHPKGQTNSNFYAFSETQEHIVQILRADTEWSSSQEVIQAIATLKDQRPEMPKKPQPKSKIDEEGKLIGDPHYDEVELTEWKTDHSQWKTKVVSYDNRYKTAAGLIFKSYCTQDMKGRLTGQSDYYTAIEQDPVAMLLRIRSICQQGTSQEQVYHRMVTQFQRTINQEQGINESTESYLKQVDMIWINSLPPMALSLWITTHDSFLTTLPFRKT